MYGNYRPISVLSVTAKLCEKLVCGQLNCYLRETKFLYFKTNQIKWILKHLFYHQPTHFLDLKKAFDTVDHKVLIRKLELYGIKTTPLAWFTSH